MNDKGAALADGAVAQYVLDAGADAETFATLLDAASRSAGRHLGHDEATRITTLAASQQLARQIGADAARIVAERAGGFVDSGVDSDFPDSAPGAVQ